MRGAVTSFQPDIVVAHNVSATVVARICRPGVPVLTVFHGVSQADYRNAAWALRLASDRVVAVADVIANRLGNACQAGVETTVIRNAVTPGHVVDRETARKELNIPLDTPVALCLARMEPQKRHDVLLDAWARMPGNELLLIAGDGSRRAALEVAARPMGDRVRFLGNRSDVPTLLAAADVTVLVEGRRIDFRLPYNERSLLDAALDAGADLPFACKGGVCCTCRTKLVEGKVAMTANYALEDWELEQGFILACQARPLTDRVIVDYDQV